MLRSRAALLGLQRSAGNQAVAGLVGHRRFLTVQRNLGVELEDSDWTVTHTDGTPEKGDPIARLAQFELQAEYGGKGRANLEIVTNPPGVTEAGFVGMLRQIEDFIGSLNAMGASPFEASAIGGEPGYLIHPGHKPFSPFLQLTVGVPLAAVRDFQQILRGRATIQTPSLEAQRQTIRHIEHELNLDHGASAKLKGFIALLGQYLLEGRTKSTFPKGSISALAKTDFASIFMMLPRAERTAIRSHLDSWVTHLTGMVAEADAYSLPADYRGIDAARVPVLPNEYEDPQSGVKPMSILTTRDRWLRAMVSSNDDRRERKGSDLLAAHGKLGSSVGKNGRDHNRAHEAAKLAQDVHSSDDDQARRLSEARRGALPEGPELERLIEELRDLHEGFGALGKKHDTIRYYRQRGGRRQKIDHRAVILEIRQPGSEGGWMGSALGVAEALSKAIAKQVPAPSGSSRKVFESRIGKQVAKATEAVASAAHGKQEAVKAL